MDIQEDMVIMLLFVKIEKINGMNSMILHAMNVKKVLLIEEVLIYYYMKEFLSNYLNLILNNI